MNIKYRPEIDGLRTVAVLAVIIYHAEIYYGNLFVLKGGFLGVDIFFVISGFLITSIIMKEHYQAGRFSIASFYERRARRILPPLFVVILLSLPFAWNLLLPTQLADFAKSILSSVLFVSNIYWEQTLPEYAAESALLKPFLHTWSLAVEEQYYIIYPLILLFIYRYIKAHTIALLTAGLLLSLQFSEMMTLKDQSYSFYLLPSRFWELLCGGLLAHILHFHPQKNNDALLNRVMPIFGLFLIVHSLVFIDLSSSHPGFITLLPVIGTVLIIWFANEEELVTKILSSKIFVGIGLVSYSLYLWHYPIFAFGRYLNSTPEWGDKALWIILTFTLSVMTYFLVEKPFRNRKIISIKTLLAFLITAFAVITLINAYWWKNDGLESKLGGYLKSVLKDSHRVWVTKENLKCHSGGGGRNPAFSLNESCVFRYGSRDKYIISIGDSHAGSLSENLRILAKANSYNFIQLTSAGCQHIKGVGGRVCKDRSGQLARYLRKYPNSIVVYSARIPLLLEMEKFVNEEGEMEDNYRSIAQDYRDKQYPIRAKSVVETLSEIKTIADKLVIIYPVLEQGFHVKDKLFRDYKLATRKEHLPIITTSYDRFKKRTQRSYQTLDKVPGNNVLRIYPEQIFCNEDTSRCIVSERDKIYYGSDNHVSPLGSKLIVAQIAKAIDFQVNPFE